MSQTNEPWVFGARNERHRGVQVDDGGQLLTVSQAIKNGGLDWMVELRNPISDDDDSVPAEEWRQVVKVEDVLQEGQTVKLHRTLGMVKGRYTLLQNRAAFSFFDRATIEGAAVIKAVGHLDHGRIVWAIAQRPETMELYPGDVIHQNLVLVTAHDGSHAVKVMFSPYRDATQTMVGFKTGLRQKTEVRVRHTKSIDARMKDAHNVLAAESGYFDRWRAALVGSEEKPGFKQRVVTEDQIRHVVSNLFPAQKKLDEDGKTFETVSTKAQNARKMILDRIDEQEQKAQEAYSNAGQEPPLDDQGNAGPTALDVFLGVSEFVAKDRKAKNEGNNWVVSTFGTGAGMRQKAFDLIASLPK
jgi:hypothetical protein